MCGMIAAEQSFRARTLIPEGAACGRWLLQPRHAPARSRVPAKSGDASRLGRRHADDAQATGWEMWRRDARPPSDSDISNKKPVADFSARALHDFRDDVGLPLICPTCQILFWAIRRVARPIVLGPEADIANVVFRSW